MTDLQSTHKDFLFEIEEVGMVPKLSVPVDQYQTAGTFSFSTSLTKDEKGMISRIIESVEKHYDNGIELEFNTLYQVLRTLQTNMKQNAAGVNVFFLGNGSLTAIVQPQILKQLVMPMSLMD